MKSSGVYAGFVLSVKMYVCGSNVEAIMDAGGLQESSRVISMKADFLIPLAISPSISI